jgi:hypothetical protein
MKMRIVTRNIICSLSFVMIITNASCAGGAALKIPFALENWKRKRMKPPVDLYGIPALILFGLIAGEKPAAGVEGDMTVISKK